MADDIDKLGYLVLCVILCVLHVPASTTSILQLSSELSWWKARDNCKREYNSDLYLPSNQPISTSLLRNGTLYWVGAYEISEWKRTGEEVNSTPFVHVGYQIQNESRTHEAVIPGNCVEQCYSHCPNYPYIGLSETRCFCLDDYQVSNSLPKEIEDQCPGNSREKCGNSERMSVYKTDIAFHDKRKGQCVYASWNRTIFLEPGSCNRRIYSVCSDAASDKYSPCEHDVCVTKNRSWWETANKNCDLKKVTNENKEKVFNSLKILNSDDRIDCWINLRIRKAKMWINGSETNNRKYSNGRNQTCLAFEYRDFNDLTHHWKPCSDTYEALCDYTELAYSVYLGSGVGLILLIGLLTAVLVACKRKEQKCFQRQQRTGNDDQTQEDITSPSYTSVNVVVIPPSAAQAQATPDDQELYSKVAKTQRKLSKDGHVDGRREASSTASNKGFEEDIYNRAGENINPVVIENFYSHLTVDGENDYDIAGRKPEIERRDSIYNHLANGRDDQKEHS